MKYTVCNVSRGESSFEVHRAGCLELTRNMRRGNYNGMWDVTATSADEVVAGEVAELEADDMGYSASDFKVFACAKCSN